MKMSRKELYDGLKNAGAELDVSHVRMKRETLVALWKERFGRDPDDDDEDGGSSETENAVPARLPLLRFTDSGWCPELAASYRKGVRRPASMAEFEALRKYAAEVIP